MELTSSKLRLASSALSIELKSSRFSKRLIAVVVLCVILAVGGGFLLGYFVKGNNNDDICGHCNSNANTSQTNDPQPNFNDVKKIFSQFEMEVRVEELRNNLSSVQFSLFSHNTLRSTAQKEIMTWQVSPEETMGLIGRGPPRYIKEYKTERAYMDYWTT